MASLDNTAPPVSEDREARFRSLYAELHGEAPPPECRACGYEPPGQDGAWSMSNKEAERISTLRGRRITTLFAMDGPPSVAQVVLGMAVPLAASALSILLFWTVMARGLVHVVALIDEPYSELLDPSLVAGLGWLAASLAIALALVLGGRGALRGSSGRTTTLYDDPFSYGPRESRGLRGWSEGLWVTWDWTANGVLFGGFLGLGLLAVLFVALVFGAVGLQVEEVLSPDGERVWRGSLTLVEGFLDGLERSIGAIAVLAAAARWVAVRRRGKDSGEAGEDAG